MIAATPLDSFGNDLAMTFARDALNLERAQERLGVILDLNLEVTQIRVVRHKPGRRCLIEYSLNSSRGAMEVLGKIRVKGLDFQTYHLHRALWQGGFDENSLDGLSVPESLGTIPEWHMLVQRKVEGVSLEQSLEPGLMVSVADLIYKLHQSSYCSPRQHTIDDELDILKERLELLKTEHPGWSTRLERILEASKNLAASLPPVKPCLIHRDCYSDQIIKGTRLYLLDLDLCCMGDPALDIGNFIAHISEFALRTTGDVAAFQVAERALEQRFIERTGQDTRLAVQIYTTLTLVRLIAISQLIPERRVITEQLIAHCEARLGLRLDSSLKFEGAFV
jgi:hypothetical protein